jgi:hypothetical protein
MVRHSRRPLRARARMCGAPLIEARHGFENLQVMFPSSVCPLRPRRRANTRPPATYATHP